MGSFINAGIKEVYVSPGKIQLPCNSAAGTPTYTGVYGMGVRQDGNLIGNHFNEMRDNKNRAFPNLFNYKLEMPTMQINDDSFVIALINGAKAGGMATAVVSSGVVKASTDIISADGGIFIFESNYALGLDFELGLGLSSRTCKVMLEGAYKYGASAGEHQSFIDNAATNQLLFASEKLPDLVVANVVQQFISPSFVPASISGLTPNPALDANIVDFMATIKTKSTKNGFNFSLVTGLEVELMLQVSGPDVAALAKIVDYEFFTSATPISIVIGDNLTINITKNGLTRIGEFEVGDANRTAKFTYNGTYDMEYVTTSTGLITLNTYLT